MKCRRNILSCLNISNDFCNLNLIKLMVWHLFILNCIFDVGCYTIKSYFTDEIKDFDNKRVLLRERKRHTACRIASAHFADLSPDRGGGGGWGYHIQSWMGGVTASSPGWGVPHPVFDGGGVPHPVLNGVLHHVLDGGVPQDIPILILDGVPPIQTWDRVPPSAEWGTSSHPDLGWGTPCPDLPPTMVDKMKTLPSVILRMRAVKMSLAH